jgi:ribonucleotide reductase alpha subunit
MKDKKLSLGVLADKVGAFTNPAECLSEMVAAYTDYLKVAEVEQTKRREIDAWEKTTIAQINAQRDFLIQYLDRTFDERAANFRALFSVVDLALASGRNDQLASALDSITEIAKSSPFKELANLATVQAALDDPDHEWTF